MTDMYNLTRADDGRHWTYVWTCTECGHDFETEGRDETDA